MRNLSIITIIVLASITAHANIILPKLLSDNMVLQRNKPITIWGWADAGEKITVQFKQQTKATKADKSGKWSLSLNPEKEGGPFNLIMKGKNIVTLTNILVGDVWVCSGQSNMEWPLSLANNATEEIKNANYPEIRQFLVQKSVSLKPEADVKGGDWKTCSPTTAAEFTAVGYFFAREIYGKVKVPIGLINTTWGGTHSETWTSHEAFEQSAEFKDMIAPMPKVDLDALAKVKSEAITNKLKAINIQLNASNIEQWKESTLDDSKWNTMKLPGLWEEDKLGEMDGLVWFRKTITIGKQDAGKQAKIELSKIDDSDESYINGIKIGDTRNKYSVKRSYTIPTGVLKEGRNVIAVRVEDTGGGGGIYGDANDLKLTTASNEVISLAGDWLYNVERLLTSSTVGPNDYPTLLFNAMLYPLLNYSIEGAIWYQGESNAGRAYQYRTAFPLMIQDWRKQWKQGDFPFYFVQLASFNSANGDSEHGSTWAELREAQTMTLSLPNTGMAVTTDIGEANDIHPRNKQDVGKRLAAVALNKIYGQSNAYRGPAYQSMKVEGNNVRITFTEAGNGLQVKDKYGYLKGFELAGADQKFYYAKAWIEGNAVVVTAEAVTNPVAVRYAWTDNPEDANLYNKEGFPAVPFRSDTWKGITAEGKFKF